MRDPGRNTWTFDTGAGDAADPVPPAPFDALSDPSVEDLLPAGLSLWPRGAAWGTPDGQAASTESGIANLTRALLAPFADLYRRAHGLTQESRALTLVDSLDDWEADFGLPDECAAPGASEAARRRALLSRVRSLATITPADFIALARQEGFEIAIEEPSTFECGFSECGGAHTVGGALQQVYWIVHVYALAVDYFTCGESECGADRLFEVEGAERLQCLFRRLYPGWTQPVYVFHDVRGADDLLGPLEGGFAVDLKDGSYTLHIADEPDLTVSGALADWPGYSFTRASTAMRVNASGVYESLPAHTLRLEHDPLTLAPLGALLEPASTNSVWASTGAGAVPGNPGTLATNWQVIILSAGLSYQVAAVGVEDGIENMDLRVTGTMTAATGGFGIWSINYFSAVSGSYYTGSAFVSQVGGSLVGVQASACNLNVSTRTGANVVTGSSDKAFSLAPGRLATRRVKGPAVLTGASTAYGQHLLYFPCVQGVAVDVTIRIGLPQVDNVSLVTSPIRTSSGFIQRAVDTLSLNNMPFSWDAGAVFVEALRPSPSSASTSLFSIGGGPARFLRVDHLANNAVSLYANDSVSGAYVASPNTAAEGSIIRAVVAWDATKFYLCLNGGPVVSVDRLAFPSFFGISVGPGYGGCISEIGVLTRCPSAAEMQARTS